MAGKVKGWQLQEQLINELEREAMRTEFRVTAYERLIVRHDENPDALGIIYALMDAEIAAGGECY